MIRPCSRSKCEEVFTTGLSEDIPFVKVSVAHKSYLYCCPRCASMDLTERFSPMYAGVLP